MRQIHYLALPHAVLASRHTPAVFFIHKCGGALTITYSVLQHYKTIYVYITELYVLALNLHTIKATLTEFNNKYIRDSTK